MTSAVQKLSRDNYLPILEYLPIQEAAFTARTCRAARAAFCFGPMPKTTNLHLKGAQLIPFAESRLPFPKLTTLTISDASGEIPIPASFNRPTIDELRIGHRVCLYAYKFELLIGALERVRVLRLVEDQGDGIYMPDVISHDLQRKLRQLEVLEIKSSHVSSSSAEGLIQSSDRLTRIFLQINSTDPSLSREIGRKRLLEELTIFSSFRYGPTDRLALAGCRGLKIFGADINVRSEDLIAILNANRNTLTHLSLFMNSNEITDEVIQTIASLPQLQFLEIYIISTTKDLSPLRRCPHLKSLLIYNLLGTEEDPNVHVFVRNLPPVTSLAIRSTHPALPFLSALTQHMGQIEDLGIGSQLPYNDAIAAKIAQFPRLQKVGLQFKDGVTGNQALAIIRGCPRLTTLISEGLKEMEVLHQIHTLIQSGQSHLQHLEIRSAQTPHTPNRELELWRNTHCPDLKLQLHYDTHADYMALSGGVSSPLTF
jgi:hypothetical protein